MITNPEFQSHNLNGQGIAKVERVKHMFDYLLQSLTCCNCTEHRVSLPPGRYLSIVKTKLEEACMFAVKAIACDLQNQEGYIYEIKLGVSKPPDDLTGRRTPPAYEGVG